VEFLGTMPFGTVAHAPRQRQRAPLIESREMLGVTSKLR
jgi:hypothetical protein